MSSNCNLFIFGYGYTAAALAQNVLAAGGKVSGTTRHFPRQQEMQRLGLGAYDFPDARIVKALAEATHLLCSIPPNLHDDPVLKHYGEVIAAKGRSWRWVGYLSTTGVYGNHDGAWVDEETPVKATGLSPRLTSRITAERKWLELYKTRQLTVHVFRLSGIYGPGRGAVSRLRAGQMAHRVYKEGQVFSRIHVADIARALVVSMQQPHAGSVYNLADDFPAPAHEVAEFAAQQMGVAVPPLIDWQQAALSPMEREFYSVNRRVKADKIKQLLPNQEWLYPSYREGILADMQALGVLGNVE